MSQRYCNSWFQVHNCVVKMDMILSRIYATTSWQKNKGTWFRKVNCASGLSCSKVGSFNIQRINQYLLDRYCQNLLSYSVDCAIHRLNNWGLSRNRPLDGNYKAEILARALVNPMQADLMILMQINARYAYHIWPTSKSWTLRFFAG